MKTQDYYNKVYHDARSIGFNHVQASICAAQSAIETGWGKSVKGNAYFGIKAGKSWEGDTIDFITHEVVKGKKVKVVDKFRAYPDFKDSLQDYRDMMQIKFSKTWNANSIETAAEALDYGRYGSYATDPKYSHNVKITAMKRSALINPRKENTMVIKNPVSKILPLYRPKQTNGVTLSILNSHKHLIPLADQNQPVKILMVRGYYLNSMGEKGLNDRAIYDDALFVVSPEGIQSFNANSDPSAFRDRIATLKSDQAVQYKPGLHGYKRQGGPYPAFRQNQVCIVERDNGSDDIGMFHINLHRGGVNGTSSAGCLTVPPHQWDEFYDLVKRLLTKHKQKTFYVTLVDYSDTAPTKTTVGKDAATVGVLVGGAAIISMYLETVSGWLSSVLEKIGNFL